MAIGQSPRRRGPTRPVVANRLLGPAKEAASRGTRLTFPRGPARRQILRRSRRTKLLPSTGQPRRWGRLGGALPRPTRFLGPPADLPAFRYLPPFLRNLAFPPRGPGPPPGPADNPRDLFRVHPVSDQRSRLFLVSSGNPSGLEAGATKPDLPSRSRKRNPRRVWEDSLPGGSKHPGPADPRAPPAAKEVRTARPWGSPSQGSGLPRGHLMLEKTRTGPIQGAGPALGL